MDSEAGKNKTNIKFTSKKAIARAIVIKLYNLKFSLLAERIFTSISTKAISFREYTKSNAVPVAAWRAKMIVAPIRKLEKKDVAIFLKAVPVRIISRIKGFKAPSAKKISGFVGQEVVANVVAWTAALVSSQLITNYFTVKNWKNGWGLLGKKDKTVVSQEAFEAIDWIVAYLIGLMMLLTVNYLMNQLYRKLKQD
jgi:hypothetical protein